MLRMLGLGDLVLTDANDYRKAGLDLMFRLLHTLRSGRVRLAVPTREPSWDRTAFVNLTFWRPAGPELLASRHVTCDELAHAAWHRLIARATPARTADAALLGEAIASAFDLYLTGFLLTRAPRAQFLRTQVPRMAERAQAAGLPARGFERLLEQAAAEPERAFESLRALLFDATLGLLSARSPAVALARLARWDRHPMQPLLHHYELSNWLLHVRAEAQPGRTASARRLDRGLRRAERPLTWLVATLGV
jgi:hypothetical protein